MAQTLTLSVPREFEVTRQFEAQDGDDATIKSLREKLFTSDVDADVRAVLGRSVEQLRVSFIRVLWGRFGQFVQRVPMLAAAQAGGGRGASLPTLTKAEVTTRYETSTDTEG